MLRKFALAIFFLSLIFCFNSFSAQAEQEKEDLKARLSDLRNKKFEMTDEYKKNLHDVERESEKRMSEIKTDFRKAREACLSDKHEKSEQLRKDFESRLKPMLKEEEGLVELIGREAREDFVKTKAEKMKLK